jgi:hypothetical protein
MKIVEDFIDSNESKSVEEDHNLRWKKITSKLNNNIDKDEPPKCGYEVMKIILI